MRIWKKGALWMEICRLLRTPRFWGAPICLAVVCVGAYMLDPYGGNVINAYMVVFDLDQFDLMVVLFAAVPFAGAFFEEWRNRFSANVISRGVRESYLAALYVTACLAAFLTVVIGLSVFSAALSLSMPVHEENINQVYMNRDPYGILLRNGTPWLYVFCRIYLTAMGAVLCVGMGVMASAVFPDTFTAIAFPFIAKYILGWAATRLELPAAVNIDQMMLGYPLFEGSLAAHIGYVFLFVTAGLLLCYFVFRQFALKRLGNEIS